jgi:hypothetical protein
MSLLRRLGPAILVLVNAAAAGQGLPGAGSPGEPAHGWVALPNSAGAVVVHLPPRTSAPGFVAAEPGAAHVATTLSREPEALAAWDSRLWLVFPPEAGSVNQRQRHVFTLAAEPGPLGSVWVIDPAVGRLDSLPSLPGDGELVGIVGTALGPAALTRPIDGEPRLLLLRPGAERWLRVVMPAVGEGPVWLVAGPSGPAILERQDRGAVLHRGTLTPANDGQVSTVWTEERIQLALMDGQPAPVPERVLLVSGQLVGITSTGMRLSIWNPTASGTYLLTVLEGVPAECAVVPLDDVGRLAITWQGEPSSVPPGVPRPAAQPVTRIAEVSVFTGSVVFSGPARVKGPFSSQELRLLAVALVGVMALVLVFVLKPQSAGKPVHLPAGLALAAPGRRMIAGLMDGAFAAVLGAQLTDVPLGTLVSGIGADADARAGMLLLVTLGVAVIHGTIGESVFGRTLGKLLCACAVACPRMVKMPDGALEPALARAPLHRALARNLIKWLIPPLAMLGMSGPDHRHRGDLAGGTVVVTPAEAPPANG